MLNAQAIEMMEAHNQNEKHSNHHHVTMNSCSFYLQTSSYHHMYYVNSYSNPILSFLSFSYYYCWSLNCHYCFHVIENYCWSNNFITFAWIASYFYYVIMHSLKPIMEYLSIFHLICSIIHHSILSLYSACCWYCYLEIIGE